MNRIALATLLLAAASASCFAADEGLDPAALLNRPRHLSNFSGPLLKTSLRTLFADTIRPT